MRIYRKTIDGVQVSGYNDSGASWAVQAGDMSWQFFDMKNWTLKDAMAFAAKQANFTKRNGEKDDA